MNHDELMISCHIKNYISDDTTNMKVEEAKVALSKLNSKYEDVAKAHYADEF